MELVVGAHQALSQQAPVLAQALLSRDGSTDAMHPLAHERRNKDATRLEAIATSNKCLTSSNKKLLETSASLLVTSALLVVTRSY